MTSLIPEKVDKFKILCPLGSGAMGVVYKAYDRQLERTVAVKVLHEHLRVGDKGKELELRFMQEAKAAARCLHPNIVTFFDFSSKGTPFIAMEYVEGVDLCFRLKDDTNIALHVATDITIQVLEALGHAHRRGVIHGDIKPANIILLADGTIKVADFGAARLDASELSIIDGAVGTPNYMSPEALLGNRMDARSDLYSVGVLFYEMLCRAVPRHGEPLDESLNEISRSADLTPMSSLLIIPILRRALQASLEDRYSNAADFIRDLGTTRERDPAQITTF